MNTNPIHRLAATTLFAFATLSHGQKLIQTPRIDRMAAEGICCTDFFSVLSPLRYA